ncbi:NAD(P)H-hydrate dehydratase [Thermoleptolyngbya oregonensis NK1-22]|uniref:Bifunctional NAD(P)H-hydrate repair enzyme n=1 Tax=Thermoleptolyngbya oregonensis NK1-22 TaxID=2547457 RepID=A0AA96Y2U7_9CYAN|nr:NAD(P)H-hydrate dehydratase [Thermoleptolyngbya oregonensis]WOB42675.1 NAD(P)H-hydrate dehydratase [Thermoleptolyngbya oregonensis NK1-22]
MRHTQIQQFVVSASQMAAIESRVFAAGMPVAALMEKVAGLITRRVCELYPNARTTFGILVGPGHNGGDALVVARELHFRGYGVKLFVPFASLKELTAHHARYAASLGIPQVALADLANCTVLIDGLFGFGLTRPLSGDIAAAVDQINTWQKPVLSIDLPSGLHTNTGAVLGTSVRATRTFCLGLWKQAFLQDQGQDWIGQAELLDFDLPLADIVEVLGTPPDLCRITPQRAIAALPIPRSITTHKYREGHLLLVCGSRQYAGAALLAAQAARASGVGMLSVAVPESLRLMVVAQVPDALVWGCGETDDGAIAQLPEDLNLADYTAIACGCGLTRKPVSLVKQLLEAATPLLLDADGLNILARLDPVPTLRNRPAPTVLTPHPGEFRRLFPDLGAASGREEQGDSQNDPCGNRIDAARRAAQQSGAIVLLKGAKVAIGTTQHPAVWLNPDSTPALARGGSGDVLTGLLGGLLAQAARRHLPLEPVVAAATWWHAAAGRLAAAAHSELGADASTQIRYLPRVLQSNDFNDFDDSNDFGF